MDFMTWLLTGLTTSCMFGSLIGDEFNALAVIGLLLPCFFVEPGLLIASVLLYPVLLLECP